MGHKKNLYTAADTSAPKEGDDVVLFLKLPPELKGALWDLAKKKGLSLSAYVRMELMSHVERQNFGVQS